MVTINKENSPFYNDCEEITDYELDILINKALQSFDKIEKNEIIEKNIIVKSVYVTKLSFFSLMLAVNFITYFYYYSLSNQNFLTY